MKSCEKMIAPESDYFVYVPSTAGKALFFYPLYIGHFFYEKGYSLRRESYNSFLILYIQKGQLLVTLPSQTFVAEAGSFVLLDCYLPHAYSTAEGCEALWCHFDGPLAAGWFRQLTEQSGCLLQPADAYPALSKLTALYRVFSENRPAREPLLSKYLSDILTALLLYAPSEESAGEGTNGIEDAIAYINEHFSEELTIDLLAEKAALSPYHFIRSFRKETGFTPHEYLINIRLNTAKYLLKNSSRSVKYICFQTGFSCESVFCSAFKKRTGMSPLSYRRQGNKSSQP